MFRLIISILLTVQHDVCSYIPSIYMYAVITMYACATLLWLLGALSGFWPFSKNRET